MLSFNGNITLSKNICKNTKILNVTTLHVLTLKHWEGGNQ